MTGEANFRLEFLILFKQLSQMERGGAVYIMTNLNKTTLYVGVTSDLCARIQEHKQGKYRNSFTHRYNLTYCVYYSLFPTIIEAIEREKQLKKFKREKKERLINALNPAWRDLWDDIKKW